MAIHTASACKIARALLDDFLIVESKGGVATFSLMPRNGRGTRAYKGPFDNRRIIYRGRDVVKTTKKENSREYCENNCKGTNSSKKSHAGLQSNGSGSLLPMPSER